MQQCALNHETHLIDNVFRNLRIKYKYSHILRIFFDFISKFGIRISPYYIFLETIVSLTLPAPPGG